MVHYDGEILVERIRNICKDKGISIAQMEKELEWSQGLISRWTKNSPSVGKIMEVVNYLEVSYEELLGEKNNSEEKDKKVLLSQKLYQMTESNKLEWNICDENFENIDVQSLLKDDIHKQCKIYYTSHGEGYFLLIINFEDIGILQVGVLRNILGKIRYPEQDTEIWMEKILELIDWNEYEKWDEIKTEYYIKQFMRTDYN